MSIAIPATTMPTGRRAFEFSPQAYARIGGLLYLFIIVAGVFGEILVRDALIVTGDAAATAHNIAGSQLLWRAGIAGDLLMHVCDVPLVLILYVLLKPVDRHLALLVVFFDLTQTGALVASKLNLLTPLFLGSGAPYLAAFEPRQLEALSYVSIRLDAYGFGMGLIFFGVGCIVLGHLVRKSGFLPKILGVLLQIAGACYLVNSFAQLLAPSLARLLFPVILIPAFIGEASFCLWLIFKGIDVARWKALADA